MLDAIHKHQLNCYVQLIKKSNSTGGRTDFRRLTFLITE